MAQNCIFSSYKKVYERLSTTKKVNLEMYPKILSASFMPTVLTCKSAKVKFNSQQQRKWGGTAESCSKQSNF